MGEVSTIGLDIAKSAFQVHGVGVDGAVVIRKRISRVKVLEFFADLRPCLVGIEACPHIPALVIQRSEFGLLSRPRNLRSIKISCPKKGKALAQDVLGWLRRALGRYLARPWRAHSPRTPG
jgi:hypothetical protein